MKKSILIILSLILLSNCKFQEPEVKIERRINSLKKNRTKIEQDILDQSLKTLNVCAVREKLNKPDLYDMKLSIKEIYLQSITNKSYNEIIEYADKYLKKNKKRIQFLEKEIENRRVSLENSSKIESVRLNDYIINNTENLYIEMNFKTSSLENKKVGYLYLVTLYSINDNITLQEIGYSNDETIGIIHSEDNSFSKNQILSKEVLDILNKSETLNYPITDLSKYNIGVKSYVAEYKEDYDGVYKPRKEDDFESKKSLGELKKDLMKLKTLVNNLEIQ